MSTGPSNGGDFSVKVSFSMHITLRTNANNDSYERMPTYGFKASEVSLIFPLGANVANNSK